MGVENNHWLPHLDREVVSEVKGNYLDAYLVALEGWRRGLTLKWHVENSEQFRQMKTWFVNHPGQLFSLESADKKHYFFRTRGDKVTNDAVELGMDKQATKKLLQDADVPTPNSISFKKETSREKLLKKADDIGYPLVVKPIDGSFGRGVFTNIKDTNELEQILLYIAEEGTDTDFLLEKHVRGNDYRLYVVDNKVVGAILRIPPNVVGDGINSVKSLISIKNDERMLNPRLMDCQIQINNELVGFIGKHNHTLESIPASGETVYLSDKANVSIGGDPIGVLDTLSEDIKTIAIRSMQAVDGLVHGAVDIIHDEVNEQTYVIELNPTSQLGGIIFPIEGKASDVPSAIIDYYFPETKDIVTEKQKVYFDFFEIIEPLVSRQSFITTVTPAFVGQIYMRKYNVFGEVSNLGYHLGLRKQAFERQLHGFVEIVNENEIAIVVAGLDEEMVDDFENGITEDEERAVVFEIQKNDYDGYVKVGFDPRANIKVLEQDLDLLLEELDEVRASIRKKEVEKRKFLQSTSWKVSKPIRAFGAIIKNKR